MNLNKFSENLNMMSFILSIYSAIVASWLAVLRFREFRYSIKRQLIVFASCDYPFESLLIQVSNDGRRPVILKSVELRYADEYSDGRLVWGSSDELSENVGFDVLPKKLEEGELWTANILRDSLKSALKKRPIQQQYYHRLWVILETLTGQQTREPVRIDPAIIPQKPFIERARHYIAADVFLGFEQKASNIYPIGIEK